MRILLVALAALVLSPLASAAGPWLGTATAGDGVTLSFDGGSTTVAGEAGSLALNGHWGLPRVTLSGTVGGLSADGRVVVLAQATLQHPAAATTFLALTTSPLRVAHTVRLRGDFGFDALSPDGRTLYLIEHVTGKNVAQYRVRAYDLPRGRLLARVIADKRQLDWLMSGYPTARATSASGRWVYTLYMNPDNYPFVHALDTSARTAVCIGLPWSWADNQQAIMNAKLRLVGDRLLVGGRFALDTHTFRVTKL
jgi:hypothetical protein